MVTFLSILLSLASLLLIVLVLLHRGKGGGLSNRFGGGVSSSLIALGLLLKQTKEPARPAGRPP